MVEAKQTKPQGHRWTVHLMEATPTNYLGSVFAKDEAEAIALAIKEFKIAEELQDRIIVRKVIDLMFGVKDPIDLTP